MNSLKILIVEDEIITATDLKETLEKNKHKITAIAKNHGEAMLAIEKTLPDLLIIDIHLRNSAFDGIETAKEISRAYHIPFVFLTAYSETPTFERAKATNPAAYLIKPFRHHDLVFQIELAYHHYSINKKTENNPLKAENIFMPIGKGHQKIVKNDVLFLKAEGAYVNVYVKNENKPFLFSMNIGHLTQYFTTKNFYQISRSYLINLEYLSKIDTDGLYLNHHESKIPFAQNRKAELMHRLAIIRTP